MNDQPELFGYTSSLESEIEQLGAVIDQTRPIAEDWRDNYMQWSMAGVVILAALDGNRPALLDLLPSAREGLIR